MDKTVDLITIRDSRSSVTEAYRALRMNLAFTSLDHPLRTFTVSSPAAAGLAPDVAANLAVVIAQAGQKVCLVDADLRRPTLHSIFAVAQEPGITTMMVDRKDEAELPLVDVGVSGLTLLPSGSLPPNPADILGSKSMQRLIERLEHEVDIVIFQTPPVTVAVDASVLAAQTDGLLLVVRTGHTRRDRVDQAKELLERFQVNILGAILTDAPDRGLLTGY